MLFKPRPKGLGKENFIRLKDREEITGVFRGEIQETWTHWVNRRPIECVGEGCQTCVAAPQAKARFRFRVNLVTSKDGKYVAKIFESGGETYDAFAAWGAKFDLTKMIVDIQRVGSGQDDTKYVLMPRVDKPITPEMEAQISAVTLIPLKPEASVTPAAKG
jgi:hypothetical protein